jgi:prepilin-type N-terminal cleavage/methylation domain-containing protein
MTPSSNATPRRPAAGFTLVELSIVLVIVGLLAGGILVGRDLIEAARRRALIGEVEKIDAAVNAFRLKFNCIPGDCNASTASQAGLAYSCGWYSDDGYIALGNNVGENDCEHVMFAYHLFQANLLPFRPDVTKPSPAPMSIPDNVPLYIISSAYPNAWLVPMSWMRSAYITGNWLVLSGGIFNSNERMTGATQYNTVLSANATRGIDTKIDDGMPLIGNVRILGYAGFIVPHPCQAWFGGFMGSCVGYGRQNGVQFNSGCVASNVPATTTYLNNDNIGDDIPGGTLVSGCKPAFKQSW